MARGSRSPMVATLTEKCRVDDPTYEDKKKAAAGRVHRPSADPRGGGMFFRLF